MPAPARFILIRRQTTGEITAPAVSFESIPRAAAAAARLLVETGVGTAAARLYANALARRPAGTIWGHPRGDNFRILIADFTSNNVPITPGLKVLDYDREWGTVEETQFLAEEYGTPGGQYFDNWYYVRRDGDDRAYKKFNGERLTTKDPNPGKSSGS
jgi:hypothetical protein